MEHFCVLLAICMSFSEKKRKGHLAPVLSLSFFFFGLKAYGILVPRTEIGPAPSAFEARSLNHWTAREVPPTQF